MAENQRSPYKRLQDRNHIAFLLRTFPAMTQKEIADELGVSESTVSRDVEALEKEWSESRVRNLDEAKQRELEKIDMMEAEAWAEWYKSKEAITTKASKKKVTDGGSSTEAQQKEVTRTGDPRYMTIIQWCIEARRKILGIDAPTKIAPTSPDGRSEFKGITLIEVVRPQTEE